MGVRVNVARVTQRREARGAAAKERTMTKLIGTDTVYIGKEHAVLKDRRVRIHHVIRDNGHGIPALLTQDEEFGGAEGVRPNDRVDIFPFDDERRVGFRGWDVPAADVKRFAHLRSAPRGAAEPKKCAKCGDVIPTDEVCLAPDEDERCHDCADVCEVENCPRCKARGWA
jgi:hypothetical protein